MPQHLQTNTESKQKLQFDTKLEMLIHNSPPSMKETPKIQCAKGFLSCPKPLKQIHPPLLKLPTPAAVTTVTLAAGEGEA
ncbi:hypothetical protein LINPERPRIM_LOCUS34651 [Linum perenne]